MEGWGEEGKRKRERERARCEFTGANSSCVCACHSYFWLYSRSTTDCPRADCPPSRRPAIRELRRSAPLCPSRRHHTSTHRSATSTVSLYDTQVFKLGAVEQNGRRRQRQRQRQRRGPIIVLLPRADPQFLLLVSTRKSSSRLQSIISTHSTSTHPIKRHVLQGTPNGCPGTNP